MEHGLNLSGLTVVLETHKVNASATDELLGHCSLVPIYPYTLFIIISMLTIGVIGIVMGLRSPLKRGLPILLELSVTYPLFTFGVCCLVSSFTLLCYLHVSRGVLAHATFQVTNLPLPLKELFPFISGETAVWGELVETAYGRGLTITGVHFDGFDGYELSNYSLALRLGEAVIPDDSVGYLHHVVFNHGSKMVKTITAEVLEL